MLGIKSTHRGHRARSSGRWLRRAAVAGVVILAVSGTAYAVNRGPDDERTASSETPSTPDPDPVGTESATAEPTATPSVAPQPVAAGHVIKKMTAAQLRQVREREAAALARKIAARKFDFTIASFNVLGSQHSTPSGDHRNYPPASRRSVGAAEYIRSYGVDVVGTQETQPDQLNALTSMLGFDAYPGYQFGDRETDNSILYDPDIFEFVSGTSFSITFMNAVRPQTVLLLRHRETGREVYFVNMHASAGEGRYAVSRRNGHLAAVSEVNELEATGIPVFVTGDMNDRAEFYCRFAPATGMVAAQGGSLDGGCHPAGALAVDWILSTPDVTFTDYTEDRSPMGRVSDHFFVTADVRVDPQLPEDQ